MHFIKGSAFHVANITGVAVVNFVATLLAGNTQLCCIDHNNVVTGVNVGGIFRFVLAAQTQGDFTGQASQCFACGVNQIPVALKRIGLGSKCLGHNYVLRTRKMKGANNT